MFCQSKRGVWYSERAAFSAGNPGRIVYQNPIAAFASKEMSRKLSKDLSIYIHAVATETRTCTSSVALSG